MHGLKEMPDYLDSFMRGLADEARHEREMRPDVIPQTERHLEESVYIYGKIFGYDVSRYDPSLIGAGSD